MYFFCHVFLFPDINSLGGHSGQFSLHLYHQDSVGPETYRRSGGAIYLPYLVLHHTAWSTQKGM